MRKFINLIIIFSSIIAGSVYAKELPNLGNHSATALSRAQEQQLGQAFMQEVKHKVPLIHDALLNNYMQALGDELVAHSDNHKTQFNFFIVKNSGINAFAGPGGYIGVYAGLILTTHSESELAAVLAHEITHVNQHHIARSVARQKELSIPTMAAVLAAVILGTTVSPDAAAGILGATIGGSTQNMVNFMRSNEQEADRIGMRTLYRAGFDPMAMPNFFERMQHADLDYGNDAAEYLRTHPLTTSRIADAKNRAQQYPPITHSSSLDYYLMQARLRVELSKNGVNAAKYFQDKLKQHSYTNRDATLYGYALALNKAKHPDQATQVINQLQQKYPDQVIYQMALAEIKTTTHQPQAAVAILQKSLEFYPDYYPLVLQYAEALVAAKQFKQACHFLDQQVVEYPHDMQLYTLLARAQGQSGNLALAYQARAKALVLNGDTSKAIIQLQQALKQPNLDHHTQAMINAQIAELKQ
jgi:predicted Zn-dependent protease